MLDKFLQSLQPDRDGLLEAISKHISDDMLEEIALADYGQECEMHLAALRRLRDTGELVEPMHWHPCEVLELIRNSEPEDPIWKPGSSGSRGHWMRAFASAALLRAIGPPWDYKADAAEFSYTLIRLINSICALPMNFTPEAVRFLAWLMSISEVEGSDEQVVYFGVGLLWFSLQLRQPPPDGDLVNLAEWIVRREEELAKALPGNSDRWLLGLSYCDRAPWEALGVDLCTLNLGGHQKQLQDWVALIGNELAG